MSESAANASSDPPTPITRDVDALFQTDSLEYPLRAGEGGFEGEIGVTFTNRSGGMVFIGNCSGVTSLSLEKRIAGQWHTVWSPAIPLCLSPPITMVVGATHRTSIRVLAGYAGTNSFPQFSITDIPGEYRAVWGSVTSSYRNDAPPDKSVLPLEQRVSNRFMLTTERR